jgi:hypothetical protein
MQAIGHSDFNAFGDSTGEFPLTFPRGAVPTVGDVGA